MRSRPEVNLRIPRAAHPGDKVPIEVIIEPLSETPIDFVDLVFLGEEVVSLSADGEQVVERRTIVERRERLHDKGTLVPGALKHAVNVKIPKDAPASYMGVRVTIHYHVRIHVSIPWWPDLDESTEILIEHPPTPRKKPLPATRSRRDRSAVIELSLADTAFSIGDEISGAFAVADLPRGAGVELSLVGVEAATLKGQTRRSERTRYMVPTVFRAPKGGVEVPFRFRVPRDVFHTFATPMCDLSWLVQATAASDTGRSVSVTVPVTISRFGVPAEDGGDRPRIGAEKWRAHWQSIGEEHGLRLARNRLALTGARGDVEFEIRRDEQGDTPALTATLHYPSLAIDLRVKKVTLLLNKSPAEKRLDNDHEIEGRIPEQEEAFFTRRLVESLRRFQEITMSDTTTTVTNPGSGLDTKSLSDFIVLTLSLAKSLIEAANAIPPPTEMLEALPAWQSFAESTGGKLAIGGMALTGATVDGAQFDVVTAFSEVGSPVATEIRFPLDPPLERAFDLKEPDPFAPPGAREQAQILRDTGAWLIIEPDVIRLRILGITADPADLRPRMGEMLLLARRLRGERTPGPYR